MDDYDITWLCLFTSCPRDTRVLYSGSLFPNIRDDKSHGLFMVIAGESIR